MSTIVALIPKFEETHQLRLIYIVAILFFGLMRIRLPKSKALKCVYIGTQFIVISIPFLLDNEVLPSFIFLCLVVVIRGCAIFDFWGRNLVAGTAFFYFVYLSQWIMPPPFQKIDPALVPSNINETIISLRYSAVLLFGLILVFVSLLINALLAEKQIQNELVNVNEQLRLYAHQIEDQATLQERNRIAREIHDSLGHSLTAQSIQLENALLFLRSNVDKAQHFLESSIRLGTESLRVVRQSVATLRTDPLRGKPLDLELQSLLQELYKSTGITAQSSLRLPSQLPHEASQTVYRIVQEAITNIIKHSLSTAVTLIIYTQEQTLHLLIEDNGKGFDPNKNTTGFGIQGMKERALILGGDFKISSHDDLGCTIRVSIPLSRSI